MTFEIGFLFAIILVMVYLFLTEKLPIDLTAFLGLVVLTLTGYLNPSEAFTGFSSTAVITMMSIFIVSGSILNTGLADMIGGRVHSIVGSREVPLMIVIMMITGALSAFMPNIAATAVFMPAVASIATRAGLAPSRLFMPLAFGAILGGTVTMVGTPPNIIVTELLSGRGVEPFGLFAFTPLGLIILVGGIVYMITIGRKLLPARSIDSSLAVSKDLAKVYELHERLFSIRVPKKSPLDGKTLRETGLRTTLKVHVVSILRNGRQQLAPEPDSTIKGGDVLLVEGRLNDVQQLVRVQGVEVQKTRIGELPRPVRGVSGVRARVVKGSTIVGKSLKELDFRKQYGLLVVGIMRDGTVIKGHLGGEILREGDDLLGLGTTAQVNELADDESFSVREVGLTAVRQLQEHVFLVRISEESPLVGTTVGSGRIGELVGLMIGGIIREGHTRLAVSPDEVIQAGDTFLVTGEPSRVIDLLEMGGLDLDVDVPETTIESDEIGIIEAVVAPRSSCLGSTLKDLAFRDRFGLQVLAIWRDGRPIRTQLAHMKLKFGDALLLQGPRKKIRQLVKEPDFVVLSRTAQVPRRTRKAPFAVAGFFVMIGMVVTGWMPIHVAAFTAASLVLLAKTLTMEEAYRAIEWRAIFLVAAVLPVGIAMERTGAAVMLASFVTDVAGPLGPYAILGSLVILSSLLSQGLDGAPAVVLLTPVVMQLAGELDLSPYPLMMGISLAASAGFMTPFSQKANLLVMGAGGYRSTDYLRVGTPLTILLLILLTFLVPVFFPF